MLAALQVSASAVFILSFPDSVMICPNVGLNESCCHFVVME